MRALKVGLPGHLLYLLLLFAATATHAQTLEDARQLHAQVLELDEREDFFAARPLAQQALAIRERLLGPKHPDTAQSLNALATIQVKLGEPTLAEPLCTRAAAIFDELHGPEHPDSIAALENLAEVHAQAGAYAKAEPIYLRVQALAEKILGPEHPLLGRYLTDLGWLYLKMGQYERAEVPMLRGLKIIEKVQGSQHPALARGERNLGFLYFRRGEYARAEPLMEHALRIHELAFGADHPNTAGSLDILGTLYFNTGKLRKAETLQLRALAIRERKLGAIHSLTGLTADHLGVLYLSMGEPAKAELLVLRSLRINEQQLGADHPGTAYSLSNLAAVYFDLGDYPKAEELTQRALRIREQALGNDASAVGDSLLILAALNAATGAYEQAEAFYQRALSINEKVLGPAHPYTATVLGELANLYRSMGATDKTRVLLQRTLAIRQTALGEEHPYTLGARADLGSSYRDAGAYTQSEELLQGALAAQQRVLSAEHPRLSSTQAALAKLYNITGRAAQGVALQERACNARRKAVGVEHPDTVRCLDELALMHWSTRAPELAAPLFAEAQAAQARISLRLLLSGSQSRKRAYLQAVAANMASHVSFSVAVPGAAAVELGATDVVQYKGLLQDALSNNLARVRQYSTGSERELLDDLAAVANQLSNLTYQKQDETALEDYRRRATELEGEQQRLEVELAKRSAALRSQISPVQLNDIRALLPRDSILIEWLRYRPVDAYRNPFPVPGKEDVVPPRYVVYLISRDAPPVMVDMGDAPSLDALVIDFRRALSNPQRSDVADKAAAVAQRVYAPLQAYLHDYRHWLISPDGALNLLPVGALPDEHGHSLLERVEISYLSSGRDLLALAVEQRRASEAVVVAAPNYGAGSGTLPLATAAVATRSAELDRSGLRFRSLPGAMSEGRAIGTLLGLAAGNVLLHDAASEAALKRLHSPRILHIATHGFFLQDQDARDLATNGGAGIPENPLLRSGLAFAGANVRRSGTREDGILTALELSQLDLRGTQLVVLSACESGVGEIQNGDGVNGLRRALALAGAQAQVTSLWKVADQPTQELMIDYYRRLLRGAGRSLALREAQLAIKASPGHAHPYYWAAFVPIGDWRPLQTAGSARPPRRAAR